uniref:Uncharacterized protein n=1 Tax=viral metagenome TaxID=1070528 RepID=A0A6M3LQJ8_9ZZZZ
MTTTTAKLVIAFFTLILGIVLIGVIADSGSLVTDKLSVNESLDISAAVSGPTIPNSSINETYIFTIINNPTGWKVADCPITNFVIYNQTGSLAVVTTDYVFTASNGTLTLSNNAKFNRSASNTTNLGYTYCSDDYVNVAWGRTIINLVAGFFALAILGVSLALFYDIAKDAGIIN